MSFMYPRTITIKRPSGPSGVGALPYQGLNPQTETTIATGLAANIQLSRKSKKPDANLPADTEAKTLWDVFFLAANGLMQDRDIIVDDLGIRYQVMGAYWNSMGYKAECERLQT